MPRNFIEITAGRREKTIKSTTDVVDRMDTPFVEADGRTFFTKAIYIGVAGNLTYIPAGMSTAVTRYNMPVGQYVMAIQQINSATTTADEIVVVYDLENE